MVGRLGRRVLESETCTLEPQVSGTTSVGVTGPIYLHEIDGLFTQRWRPGRTFGEAVGGILVMDSSDWSNVIGHHTLDTRSDTVFKVEGVGTSRPPERTADSRLLFYSPFVFGYSVSSRSHGL
jgi:hypothetical protein